MFTDRHVMTTTVHTDRGLIPVCHCGWTSSAPLATQDEAVLAEVEHNLGFDLADCPRCGGPLETVPTRWKVRDTSTHYDDRCCRSCGWQASKSP